MSYEQTALGVMPLVLTTQRDTVPTSPPIPTHDWTAEALDAVRQRQGEAITPSSTEGLPLWIRLRTALNHLAGNPLVWLAAGGVLLVGFFGRRIQRNPKIRIEYDPLDDGLGDVYLGETLVGGVTNLAPPGRPKSWQPANERGLPLPGEYRTVEQAAEVAHQAWIAKQSKPRLAPGKAQEEPELLDVAVPEWVREVEVENVAGAPGRYLVWAGEDRAGYIHKRGSNWDAFAIVKGPAAGALKQVEIGTTRKRAVTSVYVAARVLAFLEASGSLGKARSYSPRRFKRVPSRVFGAAPRTVEEFQRTKYYNVMSDIEISGGTKIPVEEVRSIGRKLAEQQAIYGIVTRKSISTFTRVEEAEERVDQRTKPFQKSIRSEDRDAPRRRRIVAKPDIRKLRKSPLLSPEEKKKLPVVRSKHAYSFAVVGPRGAVGFYEAD